MLPRERATVDKRCKLATGRQDGQAKQGAVLIVRSGAAVTVTRILARPRECATNKRHEGHRQQKPMKPQMTSADVPQLVADDHVACGLIALACLEQVGE